MGEHIVDGEFQSDKFPDCPRGLVPFKVTDTMAQDLLWEYAGRRMSVDPEFSDDLRQLLINNGYVPFDQRSVAEGPHFCCPYCGCQDFVLVKEEPPSKWLRCAVYKDHQAMVLRIVGREQPV